MKGRAEGIGRKDIKDVTKEILKSKKRGSEGIESPGHAEK